jgi:hypothetical protein
MAKNNRVIQFMKIKKLETNIIFSSRDNIISNSAFYREHFHTMFLHNPISICYREYIPPGGLSWCNEHDDDDDDDVICDHYPPLQMVPKIVAM